MANKDMRAAMLQERMGAIKGPPVFKDPEIIPTEEGGGEMNFEEGLEAILDDLEVLISMAPPEKADKISRIVQELKDCGDTSEAPTEEVSEGETPGEKTPY